MMGRGDQGGQLAHRLEVRQRQADQDHGNHKCCDSRQVAAINFADNQNKTNCRGGEADEPCNSKHS